MPSATSAALNGSRLLPFWRLGEGPQPHIPQLPQRRAIQKMVLAAPAPFGADQACLLKHQEVLGQGLPGKARPMPADEPDVQLEQRLTITFCELIHRAAPRRIGERTEEMVEVHERFILIQATSCNLNVA